MNHQQPVFPRHAFTQTLGLDQLAGAPAGAIGTGALADGPPCTRGGAGGALGCTMPQIDPEPSLRSWQLVQIHTLASGAIDVALAGTC